MRTETEIRNLRAINEFFEGYGPDTAKEYSNTFIDLISIVADSPNMSTCCREDIITKLKDLNRLVLQLGKIEDKVPVLICEQDYQKN